MRQRRGDAASFEVNRRNFLRAASWAGMAAAVGSFSEAQFAFAQRPQKPPMPKDGVYINANENPLGPCEAARVAMTAAIAESGRYHDEYSEELTNLFASQNGLKPAYVQPYAGSSQPLSYSVLAFCGPQKPVVIGDPGYEAAARSAAVCGAAVIKVPLTKDYAHDVKAMVAAAPNAGLFYVASPNNPTGTLTPRADIEWLLANKPKGAIVLLDEAYIHFSDAPACLDLAGADKDIVVLRTFSKLYGMAGARLGIVVARPDLLQKVNDMGGWTFCPVTATQAGIASLKDIGVVAQRKKINAEARQETLDWLGSKGFAFVPSEANHFMVDTKRPTKQVIDGMAAKGVLIGRAWPAWPTHVRITVGTKAEMAKFRAAFEDVMGKPLAATARGFMPARTAMFS
jgi:histidinol-phosphate aminotransferase